LRALVTRPRDDAAELARELAARGFEVMIEPMFEIVTRTDIPVALDGVQAILATSANGVRALAANTARRDVSLWAVGEATATAARRAGFTRIETAAGDAMALAELAASRLDPRAGALLHAAGREVAGDLAGWLGARDFEVRRIVLYEARAARALSGPLRAALAAGALDAALFFSPRSAATFVTLADAAGMDRATLGASAYVLSAAVARALEPLDWRSVRIAARPTQEALLAALDADAISRLDGGLTGGSAGN